MHARDLSIAGTGLDAVVDRYYNGLSADGRHLGPGWLLNGGRDVELLSAPDGSRVFAGPSGYRVVFVKTQNGFAAPSGIDASLTTRADATLALKWNRSDETYSFHDSGELLSVEDRNGNTIDFYSANRKMSSIRDTRGREIVFSYDASGRLSTIGDGSRTWRYEYDALGRLDRYTDPANKLTRYEYDTAHRLTKVVTPGGRETRIGYDDKGRVASVKRVYDRVTGAGYTTTFSYNSDHTVVTDARSHQTKFYLEDPGRVWKVVDAKGKQTTTSYTASSNVKDYTAASLAKTTNEYSTDGRDNLVATTAPTGGVQRWEYDSVLHPYKPKRFTNEQEAAYDLRYDDRGNLVEIKLSASGQILAEYSYNANGTMASYKDARGNLTSFAYDTSGRLTSVTYPAPLGGESYTYDSLHRLKTITDGKGQTRTYSYDELDRVIRIDYHDGSSVSWTYDADGNRLSQADSSGTISWTYNERNLVTKEQKPAGSTDYTYDSVGNLVSLSAGGRPDHDVLPLREVHERLVGG